MHIAVSSCTELILTSEVSLSSLHCLTGVGGIVKKQADNIRFIKNGVDSYDCALTHPLKSD